MDRSMDGWTDMWIPWDHLDMAANCVLVQQEGDKDPRSDVSITEQLVASEEHQDPDGQLEHLWVGTGILVLRTHLWCPILPVPILLLVSLSLFLVSSFQS